MQPSPTGDRETLELWYALGELYARADGSKNRSTMLAFTIVCVVGALVLLSGYFFGTSWAGAGPRGAIGAALVPVLAGLLGGVAVSGGERLKVRRQEKRLQRLLAEKGQEPGRPTRDGLHAYYDAQLVLLRSEYEYLRLKGYRRTAGLFEAGFGFTPEDSFETGPLNVAPDSEEMQILRESWERRLFMRRERGVEPPVLGLKEDLAYRVFPREMTVPVELATRSAYLTISCDLLRKRYGRKPLEKAGTMPGKLRRRIEKDLGEYAAITQKAGRPPTGAR
ncbi:MAG: hypothetical protein ACFB50_11935 [Rubrobacteraceae bacterium]